MKTDASHDGLTVQLQKHFSGAGRDFVLDLSFEVTAGITIIFGPSGAGKTTLLDCIAGLTTPGSGKITIGNRILFDLARGTNVPVQHRKIGYVFQDLALFPHLTVGKNIEYGLPGINKSERQKKSDAILESFPHLASARPQARRDFRRRAPKSSPGSRPGYRSLRPAARRTVSRARRRHQIEDYR